MSPQPTSILFDTTADIHHNFFTRVFFQSEQFQEGQRKLFSTLEQSIQRGIISVKVASEIHTSICKPFLAKPGFLVPNWNGVQGRSIVLVQLCVRTTIESQQVVQGGRRVTSQPR